MRQAAKLAAALLLMAGLASAQLITGDPALSPLVSYVEFAAAMCQDTTADTGFNLEGSGTPTATCVAGTNIRDGTLSFADAALSSVQGSFWLPEDWTGAIDLQLVWKGSAASTNNVDWRIETICVADAETMDPAFNTAQDFTDAGKGTANQTNKAEQTSITTTGCAADEMFFFQFSRDGADGTNDLYAAAAELIVLRFKIRRTL